MKSSLGRFQFVVKIRDTGETLVIPDDDRDAADAQIEEICEKYRAVDLRMEPVPEAPQKAGAA